MNDQNDTRPEEFFAIESEPVLQPDAEDTEFFNDDAADPTVDPSFNPADERTEEQRTPEMPDDPEWERPTPVAQDHHYKTWMIFIGLLLLGIAFFRPVKLSVQRKLYRTPTASSIRNASEFIALAYHSVEETPRSGSSSVSTAMFKEQMRTLSDAGYNPITLKDVRDFYHDGKLLPPKAVLLTFEQTKRSTYNQVRDILQSAKWPAVMGVNTLAVRSMNQETLIWHYLRDMHDLGFWELAAESYRGFTDIETAPNDAQATFFTSPMWITTENRYELPEELERRINEDHRLVIDEFMREIKEKPTAFFFPLGNYGQYDEKAKIVRAINLRQIEKNYDLGFIVGTLALNTRNSDPRRLNRLLVDPSWSPNAFISMVNSFWPLPWANDAKASQIYDSGSWLADWGEVFTRGKTLIMHAIPALDEIKDLQTGTSSGTTGAKAWLIGSDTFKDGQVSMLFNMRRGRFGIYLRSTNQGEYIFISLDERGNISARQKLQDVEELILASDVMSTDVSVSHNITVHLRDKLLFVLLDGNVLFNGRVLLRGEPKPGLIGASIWDPITGVAATEIISTRISGRRDAVVTWSIETGRNTPHLNKWLTDNAFRFAAISPPWIEIVPSGSTITVPWDTSAVSLIARANDSRIMPLLTIHDVDALMKITETSIVTKIRELGADGVFIDAEACNEQKMPALLAWLTQLNASLRNSNLHLMLRLPESFVRLSSSINVVSILEGVILVGDHLDPYGLPLSRAMPAVLVPPSEFNKTLNYYYQLTSILAGHDDISSDARNEELRQNGFEAFRAGAYDAAIEEWTLWTQRDPENAEPLALIGDALLRENEKTKAAQFYASSLEKNPGQINLTIRYANLLFDIGRMDDANQLMDVYARTFPDNAEIGIAQARRLALSRRRGDARSLMLSIVENQPQNVEARLVLQNYLDDPAERYENMKQLRQLVESSETYHYGFAQELVTSELLTIPEATVFFPFIRDQAENANNLRTRNIYEQLLPLTNSVSEDFTLRALSDHWTPWDGIRSSSSGKYQLRATASVSEAYLRLKKSELIRDGAISVTIDESVGAFWIYARRSSRSMLRFGYDNDGFIRMQTWFDGQLKSTEWQPWLRPPGVVTLSLEVRGDGAMGFENGRPLFSTRIQIPKEISYGWWSIAPYSADLGSARASILKIDVSPLPSGLAIIPPIAESAIPAYLELLRKNVRGVSIVAPVAIKQHSNGTIPLTSDIDLGPYQMFCAFHRIRLVPIVEAPYYSMVKPSLLADVIRKENLEGMILRVTSMPTEEWFAEMTREIEKTSASLVVVQSTEPLWPNRPGTGEDEAQLEYLRLKALDPVVIREIQLGNLILPPIQDTWTVAPIPAQEWMQTPEATRRKGIEPQLFVLPITQTIDNDQFETTRRAGEAIARERKSKIPDTAFELPETSVRPAVDINPPPVEKSAVPEKTGTLSDTIKEKIKKPLWELLESPAPPQ